MSTHKKTMWKVVDWSNRPPGIPDGEPVEMQCSCGMSCPCPTAGDPGSLVIAAFGMNVVFDRPGNIPPSYWQPLIIECPACKAQYEAKDTILNGDDPDEEI